MQIYLTIGDIQKTVDAYNMEHQTQPDFKAILLQMYEKENYFKEPPQIPAIASLKQYDDDRFLQEMKNLYYPFSIEEVLAESDYDFSSNRKISPQSVNFGEQRASSIPMTVLKSILYSREPVN